VEELKLALSSDELEIPDEEVARIIAEVDTNHDG
jgi:Ca2+-binding EF-hand superfamily protein